MFEDLGNAWASASREDELHDMSGDGVTAISKLLPRHADKLYRTYWREPDIDLL